jgi:hypothetical protein
MVIPSQDYLFIQGSKIVAEIENLVIGSWGDIKTCKTTLGLSFPTPIVHFDFDLGFERARNRIPPNLKVLEVPYNIALTESMLVTPDIISKKYRIPIKFPKQASKGILDLWENQIITDIVLVLGVERIKSLLFDTGTVMWNLDKDAQLERVQTAASKRGNTRENLAQIEYSVPNTEMRALLGHAKHYGKNLYISHHIGGVYEERLTNSGTQSVRIGDTWDGWNHLGAIVDVIVRTKVKAATNGLGPVPEATIETCGYTLSAEGLVIPNPTFDTILAMINALRANDTAAITGV